MIEMKIFFRMYAKLERNILRYIEPTKAQPILCGTHKNQPNLDWPTKTQPSV